MKLYGDYFSADTRAAIVICKMSDLDFDLELVQQLELENYKTEYTSLNPTNSVPMIVWQDTKVVSSGQLFFEYLLSSQEKVSAKFKHSDQAQNETAIQRNFFQVVRKLTS